MRFLIIGLILFGIQGSTAMSAESSPVSKDRELCGARVLFIKAVEEYEILKVRDRLPTADTVFVGFPERNDPRPEFFDCLPKLDMVVLPYSLRASDRDKRNWIISAPIWKQGDSLSIGFRTECPWGESARLGCPSASVMVSQNDSCWKVLYWYWQGRK